MLKLTQPFAVATLLRPEKAELMAVFGSGGAGGGDTPYTAQAVHFDGATSLYTLALQGGISSPVGTFFHWYKADAAVDGTTPSTTSNFPAVAEGELPGGDPNPHNFYIYDPTNSGEKRYIFQMNSSDYANDVAFYADVLADNNEWNCTAASWNTDYEAGSRAIQILHNGILQTVEIYFDDAAAFETDWSMPCFVIGSFGWGFDGVSQVIREPFIGDMSDLLLDVTTAVDLSDPAVAAKIISGGKPVDQGEDGSLLTGSQPLLYMSGDSATYPVNKGYGGPFLTYGTLTDATTSPSD